MNRQQKQSCITEVRQEFLQSNAIFVVGIKGLTVGQIQNLRSSLRKEQGKLQVVKNTLGKYALAEVPHLEGLGQSFRNQVALVFAHEDPVVVAKSLCTFAKTHERLHIVAGSLGSQVIDEGMIRYLGSLPSREIVASQVCGILKAPLVRHVSLLRQVMAGLVSVLHQKVEQLQKEV
jgi:large subunit ribosomal protein L10